MQRVYCLYRVSTKGQVDGDDIPMQKQACRAFAGRMGWTICKEYMEKGISGFKISANEEGVRYSARVHVRPFGKNPKRNAVRARMVRKERDTGMERQRGTADV